MGLLKWATESLLDVLPSKYWNDFNYLLAHFTSFPVIGSPIRFKGPHGLRLKEYPRYEDIPEKVKEKYHNFKYSNKLKDCSKEIELDRMYESHSSIFIVFDKDEEIVGSVIIVRRESGKKLPIEFARIKQGTHAESQFFDVEKEVGSTAKSIEIYKLMRSFTIKKALIPTVISMLFKAVWAKSVQINADYMFITCMASKGLEKLYLKRLVFDGPQKDVSYDEKNTFKALRKSCYIHENKLATMSKQHFWLMNYFRQGLKIKSMEGGINVGNLLSTIILGYFNQNIKPIYRKLKIKYASTSVQRLSPSRRKSRVIQQF